MVRGILKTQKVVLDAALLDSLHYKVRIKDKVEQSREWSSAPLNLGVVAIGKGSLRVALEYSRQLYLVWYLFLSRIQMIGLLTESPSSRVLIYIYIYIYIRGSLNKFPDFFRIDTFIDSTHMKL